LTRTPTAALLAYRLERAGLLDARSAEELPLGPETVARRCLNALTPGLAAVALHLGLHRPTRARSHAAVLWLVRIANTTRRLLSADTHGWIARVDRALRRAATTTGRTLDDQTLATLRRKVVDEMLHTVATGLEDATGADLTAEDGTCSCEVAGTARAELARRWVTLVEEGFASADLRAADEALACSLDADALPNVGVALHYARLAVRWGTPDDDPARRIAQWERLLGAHLGVGEWEEAAAAGSHALRLVEDHLVPGDPLRLAVVTGYARALTECDRDDEAIALARDLVWTCECEWGVTSVPSWDAYELLAGALEASGAVDDALAVRRHRVELHRETLLDVAPRRLIGAGFDLARSYLRAGDPGAAERTAREWLGCSEARLGPGEHLTHLLHGLVSSFG